MQVLCLLQAGQHRFVSRIYSRFSQQRGVRTAPIRMGTRKFINTVKSYLFLFTLNGFKSKRDRKRPQNAKVVARSQNFSSQLRLLPSTAKANTGTAVRSGTRKHAVTANAGKQSCQKCTYGYRESLFYSPSPPPRHSLPFLSKSPFCRQG